MLFWSCSFKLLVYGRFMVNKNNVLYRWQLVCDNFGWLHNYKRWKYQNVRCTVFSLCFKFPIQVYSTDVICFNILNVYFNKQEVHCFFCLMKKWTWSEKSWETWYCTFKSFTKMKQMLGFGDMASSNNISCANVKLIIAR